MDVLSISRHDIASAIEDVRGGLANWRVWQVLAWNELLQRYRRSLFGPWWLTLSTG